MRKPMTDYDFSNAYNATYSDPTATVGSEITPSGTYSFTDDGDLQVNDTITIDGASYTYLGYSGNDSILLQLNNAFGDQYYVLSNDSQLADGGSLTITTETAPFCLLAGTMVSTPYGERPVEDIRPGDVILTHDGDITPVRWVGRQSLISKFSAHALPVVIKAGALSDNTPSRDLHVSPDHAIVLDDYLVQAQALVNGTTIAVTSDPPAQLDYYHLELDQQRIIVADGAPVESFVDNVSRAGFDNFDEWVELGLEPLPASHIDLPRVKSARQLPTKVRERLETREAVHN